MDSLSKSLLFILQFLLSQPETLNAIMEQILEDEKVRNTLNTLHCVSLSVSPPLSSSVARCSVYVLTDAVARLPTEPAAELNQGHRDGAAFVSGRR